MPGEEATDVQHKAPSLLLAGTHPCKYFSLSSFFVSDLSLRDFFSSSAARFALHIVQDADQDKSSATSLVLVAGSAALHD